MLMWCRFLTGLVVEALSCGPEESTQRAVFGLQPHTEDHLTGTNTEAKQVFAFLVLFMFF